MSKLEKFECPPGVALEIHEAVVAWLEHDLHPGTCTYYLIMGVPQMAFMHAHQLLKTKVVWDAHVKYSQDLGNGTYGLRICAKIKRAREERKKHV